MARRSRSISGPITLASVAVALSIALLVSWTLILARNVDLELSGSGRAWLMVAGVASFVTIMSVLIMFSIFLVRETLEYRRQTTFIDSVTHELKSPLASIKLAAETMGRPELDQARREKMRHMVLDDVDRLTNFINDILQANQLDERTGDPISEVLLSDLLETSVSRVVRRHHMGTDAVVVEQPEEVWLLVDRTALATIVVNLIDNAIKYSDSPRKITVAASVLGKELTIRVSDNGIGIARADLSRVTERFYRVPEEAVRRRRGTGLGLFVVSGLVRRIGGKLTVHSEGTGLGTTCTVTLRGVIMPHPPSTDATP